MHRAEELLSFERDEPVLALLFLLAVCPSLIVEFQHVFQGSL